MRKTLFVLPAEAKRTCCRVLRRKGMDNSSSLTFENVQGSPEFFQNIVVMRHGDRIDHFEPLWPLTAARPWDPPLTDAGKHRAWSTGKRFKREGHRIDRVFVSPFLRCLQTAAEVIAALCSVDDGDPEESVIDPSKIKFSIEYGLCELFMEWHTIESPPRGSDHWFLDIHEIESIVAGGRLDHTPQPVYPQPQEWGENIEEGRKRYKKAIVTLANQYPTENLLFVSHAAGVEAAVMDFQKNTVVYKLEYCSYAHLRRSVTWTSQLQFSGGDFELLTKSCDTGVHFQTEESLVVYCNRANGITNRCTFCFSTIFSWIVCNREET